VTGTSRLSNKIRFAYGLPGLPLAVLGLPLFIYLPTFYAESVGIELATVGLVLLIARLWDVVTDPVIGALSDRTRGRYGRRRPWMIGALPLLCLSIWFLFVPPAGAGVGHLLVWSIALYLAWTMFQLPHAAWGAELSSDYHQRSLVTGTREALVIIGTLLAAAAPVLLAGEDGQEAGLAAVLRALAIGLIIGLPLASVIAAALVSDPPAAIPSRARPWRERVVEGTRAMKENRAFARLILAYLLNGVANGLPATLFLLFVGHVLVLPDKAGALLFIYFACAILGIPLWVWLSGRLDKHRAWLIAMAGNCLIFVWAPFLGAGDYMPFLAICVLSGLCLGADLTLPPSMQADVVDLDRAGEAGHEARPRTGLYFAFWGMATKLALALAVGITFPALDLAGFDASDGAVNDEDGLLVLALLYGVLPIAFKIAAMLLMARFGRYMPAQPR
jgi:GPH family glycoside/pentoside/hexuronide:cation symporter